MNKKKLLLVVAVIILSVLGVWKVYHSINAPMLTRNNEPVIITVDKAMSAHQFAEMLKDQELIRSTKFLLYMIRYRGMANQLKAGVYQINPGESILHVLDRVVSGDVIIQPFTIIAGSTQQKITLGLQQAPYLNYEPADWDKVKGDHPNAEGLVLADTYQYRGGSSSKTLLEQANRNLLTYLNVSWTNRDSHLPYKNPYELLIAASIIEKESAIPEERKLISGVLVNRLTQKMPLQMDPTIIYGLGSAYTGKLSHNDLQIDSPYNSYRYRGLPPTPIAMVGKEAIDAAAHPQMTKYLYFVAKGDGTHQFSETYEQQRQAIHLYQKKDY
jgi:UPF0755 protein